MDEIKRACTAAGCALDAALGTVRKATEARGIPAPTASQAMRLVAAAPPPTPAQAKALLARAAAAMDETTARLRRG